MNHEVKHLFFKILEYFLRLIKKRICKTEKVYKVHSFMHLCTQYLVGAPLAQTPASVKCGILLHFILFYFLILFCWHTEPKL